MSLKIRTPSSFQEKFYGASTRVNVVILSFRSCVSAAEGGFPLLRPVLWNKEDGDAAGNNLGGALPSTSRGPAGSGRARPSPPHSVLQPSPPLVQPRQQPPERRGGAEGPPARLGSGLRRRPLRRPARGPRPLPGAPPASRGPGRAATPRGAGELARLRVAPGAEPARRARGEAGGGRRPPPTPTRTPPPQPQPYSGPARARGRWDSPLTNPPGTTPRRGPRPW